MAYPDTVPGKHFNFQTPLLWLLIPFASGLATAKISSPGGGVILLWAVLGIAVSLLLISLVLLRNPVSARAWYIGFPAAIFLLGFAHEALAASADSAQGLHWVERPPREALFTLEIIEIYQAGSETNPARGIARITDSAHHLRDLKSLKVYFSLLNHPGAGPLIPTAKLRTRGVLNRVVVPEERKSQDSSGNFQSFLLQNGVYFIYNRGSVEERVYPGKPFRLFCAHVKEKWISLLDTPNTPFPNGNAIWKSMMLGETQFLEPAVKDSFRRSGTMHLFAISGLHIGIIAAIIAFFLRKCGIPLAITPLIGLPLIFLFVQITGNSPSAVRALMMIFFFWSALLFMRRPAPLSAWAASALVALLIHPEQLWNPGFQLSYAVVAMILLYGLPLADFMSRQFIPFREIPQPLLGAGQYGMRKVHQTLTESFAISVAAFLISQPLTIHYFGIFSPVSVFLNVFFVLLAFPVILMGVLTLSLGFILPPFLFFPVQWTAAGILEFIHALSRTAMKIPGSSLAMTASSPTLIAGAVILLLAIPFCSSAIPFKSKPALPLVIPPLAFCLLLPWIP